MASVTRVSPALRVGLAIPAIPCRTLHTTQSSRASILFALHALSNSRETQHFNKLSNLPRIEHSPPLKLIKNSEVDPYPLPTPPKIIVPSPRAPTDRALPINFWDRNALAAGRAVLIANARHIHRLSRSLSRARAQHTKQARILEREKLAWQQERKKLHDDQRSAGAWILASVGVATVLASWRFWPEKGAALVDSGKLGREIAEKAGKTTSLPPTRVDAIITCHETVGEGTRASMSNIPGAATSALPLRDTTLSGPGISGRSRGWWKGLFWVQD